MHGQCNAGISQDALVCNNGYIPTKRFFPILTAFFQWTEDPLPQWLQPRDDTTTAPWLLRHLLYPLLFQPTTWTCAPNVAVQRMVDSLLYDIPMYFAHSLGHYQCIQGDFDLSRQDITAMFTAKKEATTVRDGDAVVVPIFSYQDVRGAVKQTIAPEASEDVLHIALKELEVDPDAFHVRIVHPAQPGNATLQDLYWMASEPVYSIKCQIKALLLDMLYRSWHYIVTLMMGTMFMWFLWYRRTIVKKEKQLVDDIFYQVYDLLHDQVLSWAHLCVHFQPDILGIEIFSRRDRGEGSTLVGSDATT